MRRALTGKLASLPRAASARSQLVICQGRALACTHHRFARIELVAAAAPTNSKREASALASLRKFNSLTQFEIARGWSFAAAQLQRRVQVVALNARESIKWIRAGAANVEPMQLKTR